MKASDFTKAKGFGIEGNILSPNTWLQVILAGMLLFIGLGMGQKFARVVEKKVPNVNSSPEWQKPMNSDPVKRIV